MVDCFEVNYWKNNITKVGGWTLSFAMNTKHGASVLIQTQPFIYWQNLIAIYRLFYDYLDIAGFFILANS